MTLCQSLHKAVTLSWGMLHSGRSAFASCMPSRDSVVLLHRNIIFHFTLSIHVTPYASAYFNLTIL